MRDQIWPPCPSASRRPGYDRGRVGAGIVHFSVGNFHRAHQAVYLDRCLALPGQEGWGICGRRPDRQPGRARQGRGHGRAGRPLHADPVPARRASPRPQVVGSIVEYLFAPADPAAVLARLRDPAIRIVSLTVTEGGYNIDEATGASGSTRRTSRTTSPSPKRPGPCSASSSPGWRNGARTGCRPSPSCPATTSSTMAR